jgi:hypothetical protein
MQNGDEEANLQMTNANIPLRPRPQPGLFPSWSIEEQRGFAYFRTTTGPALAGRFHSAFWNTLVLQAAWREPAILQGLVTAAHFHEAWKMELDHGRQSASCSHPHRLEELRHAGVKSYGRALSLAAASRQGVSASSAAADPDVNLTLVACMLFVHIEVLQNNYHGGLVHVQHGMRILQQLEPQASARRRSSDERQLLLQMFRSILYQTSFVTLKVCHARRDLLSHFADVPQAEFATLDEAHETLSRIAMLVLRYIRLKYINRRTSGAKVAADVSPRHSHLLHRWQTNMDTVAAATVASSAERMTATTLQLQALALSVLADVADRGDAALLAATPSFEAIVAGSTAMMLEGSVDDACSGSSLSFEAGLIAPLYYTAMSCRHLPVRLSALRLLGAVAPRREGLWSAGMAAGIVKHFVAAQMEESTSALVGPSVDGSGGPGSGSDRLLTLEVVTPKSYEPGLSLKVGRKGAADVREMHFLW